MKKLATIIITAIALLAISVTGVAKNADPVTETRMRQQPQTPLIFISEKSISNCVLTAIQVHPGVMIVAELPNTKIDPNAGYGFSSNFAEEAKAVEFPIIVSWQMSSFYSNYNFKNRDKKTITAGELTTETVFRHSGCSPADCKNIQTQYLYGNSRIALG